MSKTVTITLGGDDYAIPALNIGQLERVTDLFAQGGPRVGFGVLRIAFERATPKIANVADLTATADEVAAAIAAVLEVSGIGKADKDKESSASPLPEAPAGTAPS